MHFTKEVQETVHRLEGRQPWCRLMPSPVQEPLFVRKGVVLLIEYANRVAFGWELVRVIVKVSMVSIMAYSFFFFFFFPLSGRGSGVC